MAYATGTATTTANLMDALLAFAVANAGMTEVVRRTETISSVSRTVVCLQKASVYWWFYWSTNEIRAMPATSSSGATWATVSGRSPHDNRLYPLAEPYAAYHFFTDGTCVHAAIQNSGGYWNHMSFGELTKVGSWTGGHYVCLQYMSTLSTDVNNTWDNEHGWLFRSRNTGTGSAATMSNGDTGIIYAPYDSKTYAIIHGSSDGSATYNCCHPTGFMSGLVDTVISASPNAFNNRCPAFPVTFYMRDRAAAGSNLLRLMGHVPGVRILNVKNLNAGDTINTNWVVFPLMTKAAGVTSQYTTSGDYGVAYQK